MLPFLCIDSFQSATKGIHLVDEGVQGGEGSDVPMCQACKVFKLDIINIRQLFEKWRIFINN